MDDVEYISHAVVLSLGNVSIIGKSHACCFTYARDNNIEMRKDCDAQGFLTNFGRFVGRATAAKIAFKAGQIDEELKILFSEDLWDKECGGMYNYDKDKGYYK